MKKVLAFIVMLCILGTSTAYAGSRHGRHGYSHNQYERSYHPRRHHNDGLGIAIGVMGGLLLGSALVSAATPPPRTVVVERPRYVSPPALCLEEQVITGEWQIREWDGRRIWVPYEYPVTRQVEVPCR